MGLRATPPQHFLFDRVGIPADPGREVAAPSVVERGHLGAPGGFPVGDPAIGNRSAKPSLVREVPWPVLLFVSRLRSIFQHLASLVHLNWIRGLASCFN
jgi:hypothetical protein